MRPISILAAFTLLLSPAAKGENPSWVWSVEDIAASRSYLAPLEADSASAGRVLFLAIEAGDRRLAVLDASSLKLLARIPLRSEPVGPPVLSPDGRFAYTLSPDGWIDKYDLRALRHAGAVRAGLEARGLALSGDGKWLLAALSRPGGLAAILAQDLTPFRVIPGRDDKGGVSEAGAVFAAPARSSFIAALPGISEIWELSHDENAEPVYAGMVHSFEKGSEEGVGEAQPFARRRTKTDPDLEGFFFSPDFVEIGGGTRDGPGGAVYNLDARRRAARLPANISPRFEASISIQIKSRRAILFPMAGSSELGVLELDSWKILSRLALRAPALFLKQQPNADLVWASGFSGKDKDVIQLIDLRSLRAERVFRPFPGKAVGQAIFSADGKTAFVLFTGSEGGIVAIDTVSLAPVKTLPLKNPVSFVIVCHLHLSGAMSMDDSHFVGRIAPPTI
ncbi:MAG: cytochrome D1 domain-containing protein [Rhodospirillales bacterium]|jgi:hypothetical protein